MAKGTNYQVGFVFSAKKATSINQTFKSINQNLESTGKAISGAAKKAVALATAFVGIGAIKGAVNTFSDFQASMSNVKALTGATGAEFEALENAALEMGKKTSKTAKESADALGYMALAGWDSATAIKGLEPVLRLSEAGALDLARTSDLVTDSMSALGVKVDDLPGFLDQVAQTSRKANTDVGMLMEAFIGVGGTMNSLGVPLDEANTALGVLANRGIKGSEAGNKLNSLLVNVTTGAGQAGTAMKQLGVKAFDSQGKFKGLENVLKEINAKTKELTEEQRNSYYAMIGGKTQVDTLNALMSGLNTTTAEGATEFDALRGHIVDSNGALMDMADTMNDNLQGAFKRLESATDDFKINMVKGVEPYLTPFIDKLAVGIPTATENIQKAFAGTAKAVKGNLNSITDFANIFGTDKAAYEKGYKLYKVVNTIGKGVKWAKDTAVTAAKSVSKGIDKISQAIRPFVPSIKKLGDGGKKAFSFIAGGIKKAGNYIATTGLDKTFTFIAEKVIPKVGRAAEKYIPIIGQTITNIWNIAKPILSGAKNSLKTAGNVGKKAFNLIGQAIGGAITVAEKITGKLAEMPGLVKGVIIAFAGWKIGGIMVDTAQSAGKLITKLVSMPGKIISCAKAFVTLKAAKAKDLAETAALHAMYAKEKIMLIANKAATIAHSAAQVAATGVTKGVALAQTALNAAFVASPIGWVVLGIGALIAIGVALWKNWDTVKAKALELWEGIKTAFEPVQGFFSGIWEGVKGGFKGFVNFIIGGINGLIRGINKISLKVPDWSPIGAGETLGFSIPEVPEFAKGGIVQKATTAVVGEKGPEAILPLAGGKAATVIAKALQPILPKLSLSLEGKADSLNMSALIKALLGQKQKQESHTTENYYFQPTIYAGQDKESIKQMLHEEFKKFEAVIEKKRKEKEREEKRKSYA